MERSLGASAVGLLPSTPGTKDTCDGALRGDDIMAELARGLRPRERPDWEETISAMARSAEVPDFRTSSNTASMKVKSVKKLSFSKGHFPKLAECAHFHYENVDFGNLQLSLADEHSEVTRNGLESKECVYLVQIHCQGRNWIVRRSYEDFRILDKHLHLCIYDRRYSQLPELPREEPEAISQMLIGYLTRLSAIADNKINCGPALTWMELDNKGNHLLVHEESSINIPAIAAAHVIKRYNAQASDELSFEVGDIVSVIDMPPKEDTTWWRGKHGFQVGFFPSECVELINDKIPQSVTSCVSKPDLEMETVKQQDTNMNSVSKKHGKLITFLRTFMKSRPSKQKLKQRGILKERVFACDLGEHLLNSGQDVPQVLRSCAEFIEKHGIVDGIYRLSGIASNIQKLRHEFDSEIIPDLTRDVYVQDIHCVGSLCKLYFRELPNPLLTYQLYEKFSDAVSAATDDERLIKIHDVIQQLPPPHYRTLEFLMKHLSSLATCSSITNMHAKNLAIVWAPNLLRSRQIESACFGGPAAFMEVRIQSVVVEFILSHVDVLFGAKLTGHSCVARPKSLLLGGLSARLLSLEEAQARTQAQISSPVTPHSRYIEVGEGPAALLGKFHTVIDFPSERKRQPIKSRKSPVGSWRSFFSLGKSSSSSSSSSSSALNKRKLRRNPSEPSELKSMALTGGRGETGTLRSAKSEESLTSLHNVEGESKLYRPRRPRSSSDALSSSFGADLLASQQHCASYDNLCNSSQHHHEHEHDDSDHDDRPIFCVPALISSPPLATETDLELMPPEVGMATLDFDPMSFGLASPLMSQRETALISTATEERTKERTEDARSSAALQSPDRTCGALDFFFAPLHPSSSSSSVVMVPPRSVETSPPPPLSAEAEAVHSEALLLDLQRASPLDIVSMETTDIIQQPADLSITTESELQSLVLPLPAPSCPPAPRKLHLVLEEWEELEDLEPRPPVTPRCRDTPSPLSPLRADDLLSSLDWPTVAMATLSPAPASPSPQGAPSSAPSSAEPASPSELTDPPTTAMVPDHHAQPQPSAAPANDTAASVSSPAQATPAQHQAMPTTRQAPPALSQAPLAPTMATPTETTPTQVKSSPVSSGPASPLSSPARQPMAVDPAPVPAFAAAAPAPAAASSSGVTAPPCSTASSSSSRERGCVSPPRLEPHPTTPAPVQTLPQAPLRPSEHPVPVQTLPLAPLRPSEHPVAVLQPQPQTPQPSTRPPPPSKEKPWEAIKPVQPRMETAPYQHFHQHPPSGPAPPPPPVRSMESKLAAAALSREDSAAYHAFLEQGEGPVLSHTLPRKSAYVYHAQGEHVLLDPLAADAYYPPHPRVLPLGHAALGYQYRADPLYAGDVSRYATIGPRSYHHSLKAQRPIRAEYLPSPGTASFHRSHGYAHESPAYPSIRRVHSLHTPTVRGPPVSRTEVPPPPPDEEMFYYQRSAHRCHGHVPPAEAQDYHVTRLQPFFENGRVQYRYSPYSDQQHTLDGPCYELDPYGTLRPHHFHSFGGRDHEGGVAGGRGRVKSGAYHYLLHQRHAAHTPHHHHHARAVKEHGFVSRDMMPAAHLHTPKGGGGCLAWAPQEEAEQERLRVHSLRRESRARQKLRGPVLSQYDNIGPYMPSSTPRGPAGPDPLQNFPCSRSDPLQSLPCSRSDPGNEARYNVTPETAMPRSVTADPDVLLYMETEKHAHTYAHTHTHTHTACPYPSPQPQHLPDASRPEDPPEPRRGGGRRPEDDPLPKPERSHSRGPPRHTSSTQSHYDNLDDYGPLPLSLPRPPPKDPLSSPGGPALFPGQAFAPPTRGGAFSTALGQGAFVQTDPPMQRVEAGVEAE